MHMCTLRHRITHQCVTHTSTSYINIVQPDVQSENITIHIALTNAHSHCMKTLPPGPLSLMLSLLDALAAGFCFGSCTSSAITTAIATSPHRRRSLIRPHLRNPRLRPIHHRDRPCVSPRALIHRHTGPLPPRRSLFLPLSVCRPTTFSQSNSTNKIPHRTLATLPHPLHFSRVCRRCQMYLRKKAGQEGPFASNF